MSCLTLFSPNIENCKSNTENYVVANAVYPNSESWESNTEIYVLSNTVFT